MKQPCGITGFCRHHLKTINVTTIPLISILWMRKLSPRRVKQQTFVHKLNYLVPIFFVHSTFQS